MEVEVKKLQYVFDFVAAYFTLFQPIASSDGAITAALRRTPAQQPLGFEVSSHARVRGALQAGGGERDAQVVVVQLRRPSRVLAVLRGQRLNGLARQTREPTDVMSYLIAQSVHRVVGLLGRVIPPLQGRAAKTDLEPRERMTPSLGGQCVQGIV